MDRLLIGQRATSGFGAIAIAALVMLPLMGFSSSGIAFAVTKGAAADQRVTSGKDQAQSRPHIVKKRNPAYAISIEVVFAKLKEKDPPTLVDVREKEQFEAVSIPGSINIPLFAVKTKTFLKARPLILVNEGYAYEPLERTCAHLRNNGFKAWILDGGLAAWKQKGGPLHGDPFQQQGLNKVPAPVFYTEKAFDNWLIVNITPSNDQRVTSGQAKPLTKGSPSAASMMPEAIHIPLAKNAAAFVSALKKAVAQRKDNSLLLVMLFNDKGEGYEAIEQAIHEAGMSKVFFLNGGLEGYDRFVKNLSQIRQAQDNSKQTIKKCINCP
jgi:rhodanese-related sulfurtransferase